MTVKELIEQLQTLDPQLEVYADHIFIYAPVADVQTMTLTDKQIDIEEGFDAKQVAVITF